MSIESEGARVINETIGKVTSEIYSDIAKPGTRQVGLAIETIFKIGLSPVAMLDWGFEHSKEWLKAKIEKRLNSTPSEFRCSPPNSIAVSAITSISISSDSPELRDLYAELLLKAMDSRSQAMVHPSFINLISQLSPQEALVFISFNKIEGTLILKEEDNRYSLEHEYIESQFLRYCQQLGFGECPYAQLWLENLQRLKLVVLNEYSEVYMDTDSRHRATGVKNIVYRYLELTEYGRMFLEACTPLSET
ncbi:DUF4393 domain-containing protein [Cellvibrio sp. KY-GH-1]|uniref:Abi-alpha family protein n=1 Tax=Cellvibrio sp. KY-GH-1 TaxID=2303332 RepID=UPI00124810FA|nr:Abi-alpha family protein [Cellvibrio sp. KY-GH-1]QEY16952.1 DUF4393 domain-containing protein [Cellvibrio sp. KY-GH-1]